MSELQKYLKEQENNLERECLVSKAIYELSVKLRKDLETIASDYQVDIEDVIEDFKDAWC